MGFASLAPPAAVEEVGEVSLLSEGVFNFLKGLLIAALLALDSTNDIGKLNVHVLIENSDNSDGGNRHQSDQNKVFDQALALLIFDSVHWDLRYWGRSANEESVSRTEFVHLGSRRTDKSCIVREIGV